MSIRNAPFIASAKRGILRCLGAYDYVRRAPRQHWQGPFNNQVGRQLIFRDLVTACGFSAIVETGTFQGDTAAYLHEQSGLPVHTVEVYPRFFQSAKLRLRRLRGVHVYRDDSVAFLKELSNRGVPARRDVFFYLDAHWYQKLPIKDELSVIFQRWPDAVIMIDDFQVIDDPGYGFDDYGAVGALNLQLFERLALEGLRAWFPRLPAADETGAKRGSIVLTLDPQRAEQLNALASLREWLLV